MENNYFDIFTKFNNCKNCDDFLKMCEEEKLQSDSFKSLKSIMPSFHTSFLFDTFLPPISLSFRNLIASKYAWAIPNNEAIDEIVKYSPIIEIGADIGYWASLISKAGADIVAFDNFSTHQPEEKREKHFDVKFGDENEIKNHQERTLFLCWAPYENDMALNCIKNYKGKYFLYVGEGKSGCNGTDEFFEYLDKNFHIIKEINIPQWYGINDSFTVYERL